MPSTAERLEIVAGILYDAGREASFMEDRGFGSLDCEPYRQSLLAQFEADPELSRVLPVLWREFRQSPSRFFAGSDGRRSLDFIAARAFLQPARTLPEDRDDPSEVLQVHAWDSQTFVFRQSSTLNPAAPIFYLLLGTAKALLIDTGAPLAQGEYWPYTVQSAVDGLIERSRGACGIPTGELLVAHTSSSPECHAADSAFPGHLFDPPPGPIDLGRRTVTVTPTSAGLSFHDDRTQWLLNGGRLPR